LGGSVDERGELVGVGAIRLAPGSEEGEPIHSSE
jgi:hypothetical protein